MPTSISILGSGGHARVVIEALRSNNKCMDIYIMDENKPSQCLLLGCYSINLLTDWSRLEKNFHVAVGSNEVRCRMSKSAISLGKKPISVIHDSALISESALILDGSFVAANVVIASEAQVKSGCIINHSAVIDHDCFIGEYSHIAPNATLGGSVQVGQQCLIGAGAVVLPNISIGDYVKVGAGSVVTKNIPSGKICVGNPAKVSS